MAKTLGFEAVGVVVWGFLVGFVIDRDWIEPTISSTGTSVGGLVGLVLG